MPYRPSSQVQRPGLRGVPFLNLSDLSDAFGASKLRKGLGGSSVQVDGPGFVARALRWGWAAWICSLSLLGLGGHDMPRSFGRYRSMEI